MHDNYFFFGKQGNLQGIPNMWVLVCVWLFQMGVTFPREEVHHHQDIFAIIVISLTLRPCLLDLSCSSLIYLLKYLTHMTLPLCSILVQTWIYITATSRKYTWHPCLRQDLAAVGLMFFCFQRPRLCKMSKKQNYEKHSWDLEDRIYLRVQCCQTGFKPARAILGASASWSIKLSSCFGGLWSRS